MPKIFILLLTLLFTQPLYAQNFKGKKDTLNIQPPNNSLSVGETLNYSVEWLGIPVGIATLKIEGVEKVNGHDCYHLWAKAQPNNFLKGIINLEYRVDSYLDVNKLCTRKFEKKRTMNGITSTYIFNFDPENNTTSYIASGNAKGYKVSALRSKLAAEKPFTEQIPPNTQDLLSAFYYFRLLDVKELEAYSLNIYYDRRNWKFDFKTGKPYSKDIRKKGTYVIFDVTPESELNDFILGKNRFLIKYNADSSRVPIEFRFGTGIGAINARIQEVPR